MYQQTVASVEIVSVYNWFIPKETRKEREKSGRSPIDGTQHYSDSKNPFHTNYAHHQTPWESRLALVELNIEDTLGYKIAPWVM